MSPGRKFELPPPLDLGVCGISEKPSPIVVSASFSFSPLMILKRQPVERTAKNEKGHGDRFQGEHIHT